MARKPRATTSPAAKAIADKYIAPKGGKGKAKERPAEDYELSAASIAKGRPPPEIRVVEKPAPEKAFTPKEAAFVDEYLIDFNATQAAIRAGYSKATAAQAGYQALTRPHVARAIERAKRERAARAQMTADAQLADLLRDRFADIGDLFDENGAVKPIADWPLEFRLGLVSGVEVEELFAGTGDERQKIGQVTKLKLADRTAIKKMIGDHVAVQSWNHRRTLEVEEGSALAQLMREIGGRGIRPRPAGVTPPPKPTAIGPKVKR